LKLLYRPLYNYLVYPGIIAGARIGSFFNEKLKKGFEIHKGSMNRWLEKEKKLDPRKPRIWFHATSTGEFEAARPVMEEFKKIAGDQFSIIFSYYSPTVHKSAQEYSIPDLTEVLPLDTKKRVRRILDNVKPAAIVFICYDTWPNIIWEAADRGIRLFLIDATLRKKSFRFSTILGRNFSRSLYTRFNYIGASSKSDAERLKRLCGDKTDLRVMGDSRIDRVRSRRDFSASVKIPLSLRQMNVPVFVCGSTWESDEVRIIPAVSNLLKQGHVFHTVIVPHEPSPKRIHWINNLLENHHLSSQKYSDLQAGAKPGSITILDAVGFLAEFYRIGQVCYVGGGFLYSGVHNCLEPAVMGMPLCFGPRYHNSPEAESLIRLGAASEINKVSDVENILKIWLLNPQKRLEQGSISKKFIEDSFGVSRKYCEDILEILQKKVSF
jgi:3-deoxy-D-manno-octulosonic-acid transferase